MTGWSDKERFTVLSPNGKTGRWPNGLIFQGTIEKATRQQIPSDPREFTELKDKAFIHNDNLKSQTRL